MPAGRSAESLALQKSIIRVLRRMEKLTVKERNINAIDNLARATDHLNAAVAELGKFRHQRGKRKDA